MAKARIALSICVILLVNILFLSSCTEKQGKVEKPGEDIKSQVGEEKINLQSNTLPLVDKPITLRWATHENYYEAAGLNSGLEVWKRIEEQTNVKIEWDVLPFPQYDAAMQIKLSSGNNLPDIVVVPNYDPTPYGQSGLFISIEDYIEKYAPNIKKVFSDYPGSKELMTSSDGHIYGLASIVSGSADTLQPTFTIRKDWLDKLNIRQPNTLDEWVHVLRAFKKGDPNGNGENDEIPFMGTPHFFSEAFGMQLKSGSDYVAENGIVKYQWVDQRMKEYLEFVNLLYSEGLFGYNYWDRTWQLIQSNVMTNRVGAFVSYPDWISSWEKKLHANGFTQSKYIPILPPMGRNGERSLDTTTVVDKRFSSITQSCKDPVTAIRLLDYIWSEEGIRYMAWGIEGKTYVMENNMPTFTDFVIKNPDGLGMSDALRSVGAWPTIPWVQQREQYEQMLSLFSGFEDFPKLIKPILKEPFPMLLAGKEEQQRLMELESDINNYREEMINKFIIGKEPIENFDQFVAALKGMGLEELISIKQKQYDRYKNR